jgi:hypothetical protein
VEYANFAKSTGMPDAIFHYPAPLYRQLLTLEADLVAEGPLHAYLKTSFGLPDRQFAQLVKNTLLAAATRNPGRGHIPADPADGPTRLIRRTPSLPRQIDIGLTGAAHQPKAKDRVGQHNQDW